MGGSSFVYGPLSMMLLPRHNTIFFLFCFSFFPARHSRVYHCVNNKMLLSGWKWHTELEKWRTLLSIVNNLLSLQFHFFKFTYPSL